MEDIKLSNDNAQQILERKAKLEYELTNAESTLNISLSTIKYLDPQDITYIKSYNKQNKILDFIITAVCLTFDIKPTGGESYFTEAKKNKSFLNQEPINFINQLLKFDKEKLNQHIIKELESYVDNHKFNTEFIFNQRIYNNDLEEGIIISRVCVALSKWVSGM